MKRLLFLVSAVGFIFLPGRVMAEETDQVSVHFLSVGQADSTLIQTSDGKNVLIDGGANNDAKKIVSYLKKRGVDRINILIATHPHHDHIGAMDKVIDSFPVDLLYIPPLSHKSPSYRDFEKAVKENKITVFQAKVGQTIRLANDVRIDVLAPLGKNYSYKNDYSLVAKLTYGDSRFLFMGDAGMKSENEMLKQDIDLKADVIKIAHHGGDSSTSTKFLNQVDPKYAILSIGNQAGFPSEKVINKLKRKDVTILPTKQLGDIVAVSDGESIVFHMRKKAAS